MSQQLGYREWPLLGPYFCCESSQLVLRYLEQGAPRKSVTNRQASSLQPSSPEIIVFKGAFYWPGQLIAVVQSLEPFGFKTTEHARINPTLRSPNTLSLSEKQAIRSKHTTKPAQVRIERWVFPKGGTNSDEGACKAVGKPLG